MMPSAFTVLLVLAGLWLVLAAAGLCRALGTNSTGYALVSPTDGPSESPPPMVESDDDENGDLGRRVILQPVAQRQLWTGESNASILRAAQIAHGTTYNGSFTCLASGLHVSNFHLDQASTVDRLQRIVDGTLPRSSVLAAPWRGVEQRTLNGVLRVLHALDDGPNGRLDLALLTRVFHDFDLPNTLSSIEDNTLRAVGRCAPIMLVSTGATEASLGERLIHGERLIFHRPTELLPVLSLYKALAAHEASVINRQLASLVSLPLAELQAMAGSTEAKKVLIAAVGHLSGKRRLAKFHNVSAGKVDRAEAAVSTSLVQLGKVHEQVYARLAEERTRFQQEAAELAAAAEAARTMGKASGVVDNLQHLADVKRRWAAQRDPYGADFGAIFKRRWRNAATQLDGLKHLSRGHNPSIHVKYPNFKAAVQSIVHDLNGRADKGRQSATVYLGNSTWKMIARRLNDAAYMATLGGVVPATVSALWRHKARSARSKQPKCSDPSGQLDVSHRKVCYFPHPSYILLLTLLQIAGCQAPAAHRGRAAKRLDAESDHQRARAVWHAE